MRSFPSVSGTLSCKRKITVKEKWKLSFVKVQQKPFLENVISEADYLWVMRYGDGLEIISPKDIRKEFAEELKKVSDKYSDE